jgi:hypothetical protein
MCIYHLTLSLIRIVYIDQTWSREHTCLMMSRAIGAKIIVVARNMTTQYIHIIVSIECKRPLTESSNV